MLRLESRNINDLWVHPKHRKCDARNIANMAASIANSGICTPIVITEDGEILDGLLRYWATLLNEDTHMLCVVENDPNASEKYFQLRIEGRL